MRFFLFELDCIVQRFGCLFFWLFWLFILHLVWLGIYRKIHRYINRNIKNNVLELCPSLKIWLYCAFFFLLRIWLQVFQVNEDEWKQHIKRSKDECFGFFFSPGWWQSLWGCPDLLCITWNALLLVDGGTDPRWLAKWLWPQLVFVRSNEWIWAERHSQGPERIGWGDAVQHGHYGCFMRSVVWWEFPGPHVVTLPFYLHMTMAIFLCAPLYLVFICMFVSSVL